MKLYTIGFTQKSAQRFFDELLAPSGARRVLDVRLKSSSQLAGFAKVTESGGDFQFLLRQLCGMGYLHLPELAPTPELLADWRAGSISWSQYSGRYRELLKRRKVEQSLDPDVVTDGVLLCSEHEPRYCHRRLAAEYLRRHWGDVEIIHL